MDRAAHAIALELRKLERLANQALAGKCRIAVQQHAHDLLARAVLFQRLLGAHAAQHDRVDRLEVGGVRRQRQMDAKAIGQLAIGRGAQVIFHIARALHRVDMGGLALELGEHRGVGLAHDARQHIEPAAMGHADHDFIDTLARGAFDDRFHRRNHGLAAFEREALGAAIFDVDEGLEAFGLVEIGQDGPLLGGAQIGAVARALDAALDPGLLIRALDVHELDADARAIGLFQDRERFAQRAPGEAQHAVEIDWTVIVGFSEAVARRVKLGMVLVAFELEWIQRRDQMAAHAIGADQHQRTDRIARRLRHLAGSRRTQRRRRGMGVAVDGGRRGWGRRRFGVEANEEVAPRRFDRRRVAAILRLHGLDEGRVGAIQE